LSLKLSDTHNMTKKNHTSYPIDGETADNIAKIVLGETVKNLKDEIKKCNKAIKAGETSAYIYEDLNDNIKYLQAAEHMFQYFGGK